MPVQRFSNPLAGTTFKMVVMDGEFLFTCINNSVKSAILVQ